MPIGGTIFLKAGYYELSDVVTLNKKVNIVGEGIDKTFIVTADAIGLYLDVDSSHSTLKDFTVDGDAQTDGTGANIVVKYANYLLLENIKIKNAGYYGIDNKGSYCIYKNIYAVDNYRHGIHPGGSSGNSNQYNIYRDIYCWDNGVDGFADKGDDGGEYGSGNNLYDNLRCWGNGARGIHISYQDNGTLINSLAHNNGDYGIALNRGV